MTLGRTVRLAAALAGAGLVLGLAGCGKSPPQAASSASSLSVVAASSAPPAPPSSSASAAPAAATTADADDVRGFLTALYSHYGHGANPPPDSTLYDKPMLALMAEDRRLTGPDDEGALDFDPICACQDDGGMRSQITVTNATPLAATAVVVVSYPGPQDVPTKLTFDLVKAPDHWRIHDIHFADMPSLRQLFIDSNKKSASHPAQG